MHAKSEGATLKSVDVQFLKLAERASDKARLQGYESLSEKERIVFCVHALDTEIANGGFYQYLWGPSGDQAPETAIILAQIGAVSTARLLREALRIFPEGRPPKKTFARQREMKRVGQRQLQGLSRLDHQFFEYQDNLPALTLSYLLSEA